MAYYLENLYKPNPDNPVKQALSTRHNFRVIMERINTVTGITANVSNMAVGYQALYSITTGNHNIALGHQALYFNSTGYTNVALGFYALYSNSTGHSNVGIGYNALYSNTAYHHNVAIGTYALHKTLEHYNTALGCQAGFLNETGYANLFLGFRAGYYETGRQKLYIDVTLTTTPLIYGDFGDNFIEIYGNLGIGTRVFGTSGTRVLGIINGTIPSTSITDGVQLYAEDVSASSELKVRDEATNVTTLSPHNFELFEPDKNDPFPWSYHSVNQLIGKKVNADISGALGELEQLSGKKFLYYEDVDKISLDEYMEDKKQQLIANYIAENRSEVEVEKDEAWGEVEVEVQDMKVITGYDTRYEFDEKTGGVKEIKNPKYGKKNVLKNRLRKDCSFNEEAGKFLKIIKPTEKEAEKAIKKELVIPKWIEERM